MRDVISTEPTPVYREIQKVTSSSNCWLISECKRPPTAVSTHTNVLTASKSEMWKKLISCTPIRLSGCESHYRTAYLWPRPWLTSESSSLSFIGTAYMSKSLLLGGGGGLQANIVVLLCRSLVRCITSNKLPDESPLITCQRRTSTII